MSSPHPSLPPAPSGLRAFVAREADLPELVALGDDLFGHEALTRANWRYRLLRGHSLILGLRDERRILCYTVVELNVRQRRAYVVETGTAPEARGRGLARWVRAAMHGVIAAQGYRTVATHVRVRNTAAQQLNLSLGMRFDARILAYYDDGEDAFSYRGRPGEGLVLLSGPADGSSASPP